MRRIITISVLILSLILMPTAVVKASANLIVNPSAETGTTLTASNWSQANWGNLTANYSLPTTNPQNGNRSMRIDVDKYTSGDAKWYHDAINVTAGTKYSFSNWYKSNVQTDVDVEFQLSNGSYQYVWLGGPEASSTWKQFAAEVTVPTNAVKMIVFQAISKQGWVQTDNYSLTPNTVTPPTNPSGAFSRPLVSIEFDDGWESAYQLGLPLVESYGWKATNYIVTETPGWDDYMTNAQIVDWNRRGDIGSHSVTHSSLPNMSKAKITKELKNSKSFLDKLLGEQTKLLATPYCESNNKVVSVAKSQYSSLRNCIEDINSKTSFNRYDLKSFIVLNTTTDAEITTLLNKAKANNGWLILVWHEVAGDNKNEWSVSQATLQRQLNLVKNSGIDVVLTQQALNESTQ